MTNSISKETKLNLLPYLSSLIVIIPEVIKLFPQVQTYLGELALQWHTSKAMLNLLSLTLTLVSLTLFLTITYIVKFNRNLPYLPPKKDIKKICEYIINHGHISTGIMAKDLNYSNTKAILYPTLLKEAGFFCNMIVIPNPDKIVYWGLGKNGKIFAIKHKLD